MDVTTSGRFRVRDSPRGADELLLIDCEGFDPSYVTTTGYEGELAETVAALRPGYRVEASLAWHDGTPRFADLAIEKRTRLEFVTDVTGVFEAARDTWQRAVADGDAMNSRVTRNTDGDPNGVLYVFAKQPGAQDLFAEFRDGSKPLEPLIQRVNEQRDEDHEVFVMNPADEQFVLVYIVFEKDGLLAQTVRDTYDCPRSADRYAADSSG